MDLINAGHNSNMFEKLFWIVRKERKSVDEKYLKKNKLLYTLELGAYSEMNSGYVT